MNYIKDSSFISCPSFKFCCVFSILKKSLEIYCKVNFDINYRLLKINVRH